MHTDYWLTRLCFQRSLAFIYLVAFLIAANQFVPLLGACGLQPVRTFLRYVDFRRAPSLFFLNSSDRFITGTIWLGLGLSVFALSGYSESFGLFISMLTWFALWLVYLSLVNVGQTFYGFGWETMLLETGFLAIVLGSSDTRPPAIIMWLIVWILFRVMFGAGMIKIRADPCWRDLTCLYYHYETQPLPNPLSWYLHHAPRSFHKLGVLFNHFVELIVPWFYFLPAPICYWAGGLTILFQVSLIISGNLSWLNYITIVLCIPCFDDRLLGRFIHASHSIPAQMSVPHQIAVGLLSAVVLALSWWPARNIFSRRQLMNASFDPLHLVNTYGAFGAITRERHEIVIKGTDSLEGSGEWKEYEFKGKPGDPKRRPCIVSPYHWKLDWQMWFAAMSVAELHPWIFGVVEKLLEGDRKFLKLLAHNPFPDAPPKYIRADLYLYQFTKPGQHGWWKRTFVTTYIEPMTLRQRAE